MTDYQSPLETYSARSAQYTRAIAKIALLLSLLLGIIEIAVSCQSLLERRFGPSVPLEIGMAGLLSVLFSAWALFRVRTFPIWKLIALWLTSTFFGVTGLLIAGIAGMH